MKMGDRGRGRGRKGPGGGGVWGSSKNDTSSSAPSEGFWAHSPSTHHRPPAPNKPGGKKGNIQSSQKPVHTEEETKAGERKFAAACKEIQDSVQRYIATHQFEDSEDDDEEEDEEDLEEHGILERVFGDYGGEKDQSRTQQYLQEAFKTGALVCLICIENIKRNDRLRAEVGEGQHLPAGQASTTLTRNSTSPALCGAAPSVGVSIHSPSSLTKYLCFCGKKMDPQFDPWLIPHTYGATCKKKLQPECGHTCLLLCHPGPCPPCPKTVASTCHCRKQPPETGTLLVQNLVFTPAKMLAILETVSLAPDRVGQSCCCGSSTQLRECADPVCNNQHSCGHHLCQNVCHSGSCGECPASGVRTCPCGKTSHTLPCTKEIPTCGDTCGKELACGVHYCAERCHKGPCPTCLQFRVKWCRCGTKQKEIACSKELTCEVKCKNMRDCRRHTCNKKCCVGDCPRCEQPCGRTLVCRNHKCESRCHQGPCYPCAVTHTISCRCGASTITVPCGREKTTKPPKCSKRCKLPPNCHHPHRQKHKCHQGPCPTCRISCGLKLKCGHICPVPCHDAVPVKIVDTKKRAGPWEPVAAPHIEIQKKPCPPCQVPVPTTCFGQHENPNWPCGDLRPYSCGRKCGRSLDCTNHTCDLECHMVESAPDDKRAGSNCAPCEKICSKPRLGGCNHECGKPCHPGECKECEKHLKIKCHCGLSQLYVKCHLWNSATDGKEKMRSCKNQCNKLISCNHRCTKDCHTGPCSLPENCHKRVAVRCPCKRQRKDFFCNLMVAGKVSLECDDVCITRMKEKKKAQEEEERKKIEEEKAKQKRELEEFERKMEGRKHRRRNRRQQETEAEPTFWQKYGKFIMAGCVLLTAGTIYVVINK
ncbi:NF-X1-type zinc finger protein NFXL1-like [Homarus americanus]|uniref:NF-X1-type zinc finger protein NFXL1-like n=1 Tax=Homarus americanus TaxID=6706 RepID=A0A8J5JM54_HOMAM|nr:NF-X1-type zinc finger protein NFXL1-like [Homarus americanus]